MLVDGGVVSEFGVEGGGEEMVFLDESGGAIEFGEDGNIGGYGFDNGTANENHFERIFFQGGGAEENIAGELAAVGVAKDGHVQQGERGLDGVFDVRGEKDGTGAGAENGSALGGELTDGVEQAFFLEELKLRGALAAREDEGIGFAKIGDGANLEGWHTESVESSGVCGEVALNGEDADFHRE